MLKQLLLCAVISFGFSAVFLAWLPWQESCKFTVTLSVSLGIGLITFVITCIWPRVRNILLLSALYLPTKTGRTLMHGFILSLIIGGPLTSSLRYLLQISSAVQCASQVNIEKEQNLRSIYETAYVQMFQKINETVDTWQKIASSVDATTLPLIRDVQQLNDDYEFMSSVGVKVKATCMETLNDIYQHCSQKVAAVKEYCEDILSLSQQKSTVSKEDFRYLKELKNQTRDSPDEVGQHNNFDSFSYLFDLPITFCQKLDLTMHMCKPIKSGERICTTVADPYQRMKRIALDSFDHLKKFRSFFSSQDPTENKYGTEISSPQIDHIKMVSNDNFGFTVTLSYTIIMLNLIKYSCLVAFLVIPVAISASQYNSSNKWINGENDMASRRCSEHNKAEAGDILQTFIHLSFSIAILLLERTLYACLRQIYDHYYGGRSHHLQSNITSQLYGANRMLSNSMEKGDNIRKMLNTFLRQFESLLLYVDDTFLDCLRSPLPPTSFLWLSLLCFLYLLVTFLLFVKRRSFQIRQKLLESTVADD